MFDSTGSTFGLPLLFNVAPRSLLLISVAHKALLWICIAPRALLFNCVGTRALLLIGVGPRAVLLIVVAHRALLLICVGSRALLLICNVPRALLLIWVGSRALLLICVCPRAPLLIWVDPRTSCMICLSYREALLLIYLSRALLYLGRTTCSFRKGESPAYTDTGALRGTNTVNALTKRTKYISIAVVGSICKESIFPHVFFCLQLSIACIYNGAKHSLKYFWFFFILVKCPYPQILQCW